MSDGNTPNNGGRSFAKIMDDVRESSHAFQTPAELITLLGYSINLFAALRTSIESGIFRQLSAAGSKSLTSSELAKVLDNAPQDSSADEQGDREEYVTRMARAVAGMNLIDEVGPSTFKLTN